MSAIIAVTTNNWRAEELGFLLDQIGETWKWWR